MPSLLHSSLILAFARFTNYAFLVLSPIVLVRLLDQYAFGQYREFMLYAGFVATMAAFSISSNLLFFVPHDPSRARMYISHTNILTAGATVVACLVVWLLRDTLEAQTSYSFMPQLVVYVLLFVNLDFLESYWLATQRPQAVLYYSTLRTLARLGAVIAVAVWSGSVIHIVHAVIAVEAVRIIAVLIVMQRLDLLNFRVDAALLWKQLAFIVPLGLASCLHYASESLGQFAVSVHLGVTALATYTVASYQVPVLSIVRGAIGDAIFPSMVKQAAGSEHDRLLLWKRGNVAYSALIIPIVVALIWYADVLIPFVFSERYTEAVPIFRVLCLVLLIQCFEFSSPLRAVSRTSLLLSGNILLIVVNLGCILLFFRLMEENLLLGPAVAIVVAYLAQLTYLGRTVMRVYGISLSALLKWRSLGILFGSAVAASVVLFLGELLPLPPLLRVCILSGVYIACYGLLVSVARIEEVQAVLRALLRRSPAMPTAA